MSRHVARIVALAVLVAVAGTGTSGAQTMPPSLGVLVDQVLALFPKVDGEVIGQADLHGIDHFNRRCELGIEIGREYWGKGFGQDTVRTLVEYAFEHLNMNRVGLQVLAEDPRAVGAYRKAGFVEEGRIRQHAWVRGRYEDELVMSVLREEWTPRT